MVSSDLGPTLITERLILRPPVAEDFEPCAQLMADEATARYIGGVQPRAVSWRGFIGIAGAWSMQGFSFFTVVEKATGQWVGRVGPWQPEGWPGTEVGWSLGGAFHGKGYATEAAWAVLPRALDQFGPGRVVSYIDAGNARSARIAVALGAVRDTVAAGGTTCQASWL